MGYFVILAALWLYVIGMITVMAQADWVRAQLATERASVEAVLGIDIAARVSDRAAWWFDTLMVKTGVADTIGEALVPTPGNTEYGLENLAPTIFSWVEDSLNAMWILIYQAMYRTLLIVEWSPYLGAVVAAAVIDGLVSRKIRKSNDGYANPIRHRAGMRALLVLVLLPFIYLTVPLHVTPMVVPVWLSLLALTLMLVSANEQDRI